MVAKRYGFWALRSPFCRGNSKGNSKGCVPMSSFDLLHQYMNHWLNYLELSWNVLHTHTPHSRRHFSSSDCRKECVCSTRRWPALYLLVCGFVQLGNKNDQGHPAEIEHFRCCLRFFLSHWPLFCSISCLTARLGGHVVGSARPVPGQSDHQSTGPLQANTFHRERSQEGQWSTRTQTVHSSKTSHPTPRLMSRHVKTFVGTSPTRYFLERK